MWVRLGVSEEEWNQTPASVREAVIWQQQLLDALEQRGRLHDGQLRSLQGKVAELEQELAAAKERLGQNSQNSSRPPSSDTPYRKPVTRRPASNLKRGGQPGHCGHWRRLKPRERVDSVVELRPSGCAECGALLLGDDPEPERRQVSEVPPAAARVTEYRRHCLKCLACGTVTAAAWPEAMPRGQFGPRAQAIVAYLSGRLGVSQRDISEALSVLHGLELGLGSVSEIERRVSAALAPPVTEAQAFVRRQAVRNVDETGWKEANQGCWLWLAATTAVTVFQILRSRGSAEAREVIGAKVKGVIGTDRYQAYNWLALRQRQICSRTLEARLSSPGRARRGGGSDRSSLARAGAGAVRALASAPGRGGQSPRLARAAETHPRASA
jgi:transposase